MTSSGMVKESAMNEIKQKHHQIVIEELWLRYYNDYLYEHGVISEQEYRQMFVAIIERTGKLKKKLKVR